MLTDIFGNSADFMRRTMSGTDADIGLSTRVGDFDFCQYDWLCILLAIIAIILFFALWRRKRKINELEDELEADGYYESDEDPESEGGDE